MDPEEKKALNELKLLVKKANQRILRIEKLTGVKEGFATKELFDYLSSKDLNMVTSNDRVRFSLRYSLKDIKILNKALNKFLKSGASTKSEIEKIKEGYEADISSEIGIYKPLSYKEANVIYQSNKRYTWIYDYIPKSEFWGYYVKACNAENWSQDTWIDILWDRISDIPEKQLKIDLEALYVYIKE